MRFFFVSCTIALAALTLTAALAAPPVFGQCAGDCSTVSPVSNVPVNIDLSNAVHLEIPAEPGYRFWAVGESGHAPDGCGRYTDVLLASAYGNADLLSIPIGGAPVELAASSFPGTRLVNLFFVEFGDGYLGDNWGATQVFYQPLGGGQVQSVQVNPVANIAFNAGVSNCQTYIALLDADYDVCATGASHYAGVEGLYNEVFLCSQRGCDSELKAVPVDTGGRIYLSNPGVDASNPVYLWFPEFGSGYTGDNWGQTQVCFQHPSPVLDISWGKVESLYR